MLNNKPKIPFGLVVWKCIESSIFIFLVILIMNNEWVSEFFWSLDAPEMFGLVLLISAGLIGVLVGYFILSEKIKRKIWFQ